jgi:HAMP domain-containing protein
VTERARSAPLTRRGIAELARMDRAALERALPAALEARDIKAATSLALAIAATGGTIEPRAVLQLVPDVDPHDLIPPLLRACRVASDEERLEIMRQAIERGQLSHDCEAIIAFLASRVLGEPPWPAPWPGLIRTIARQQLGTEAGVLLGLAIERSGDAHVKEVGAELVDLVARSDAEKIERVMIDAWEKPVLELLPETEPPRIVAGYTVRKAAERPGRNDPCHCGSGKKYKKCCAAKDEASERTAESPLVDAARVTANDVEGMRIQDVLALPFERLQRPALVAAIGLLRAYHRWEDAERALDVLAAQAPGNDVEDLRAGLMEEALRMRALDVVERQVARLADPKALPARVRAALVCAQPTAETLVVLDEHARRGLHGDADALADVAYSLLDHAPALGILVARGALDPERTADSDSLLVEIEYARDRLELPPGDPYGPLFDEWVMRHKARAEEIGAAAAELARLRQELERAEEERDARRAQVVALECELREVRERYERLSQRDAAVSGPAGGDPQSQTALRAAEERARRLALKVDELKAELADKLKERADLLKERADLLKERADLRNRIGELEEQLREACSSTESGETALDPESGERGSETDDDTMPVRVPIFVRKACEALQEMPGKVQRAAVVLVGRLGAGERAAWRDVKRMQGMEGVWTARVGIHHRLIFRVSGDELTVLDIVTREALLTSLERYR